MSTRCFEIKVMLFIALFFVYGFSMTQAQTDVTDYETVTVSIPATSYDADKGPEMARVKYNKTFPLVITSDDMGKTELTNNWAEVNGYPNINANVDVGIQPGGTDFLAAPYKKYYMQGESSNPEDYQPMTYTDNVGKTQRYRMTSAIMPYLLKSDGTSQYDKIDAYDAKLMLRTGWSFAQHDVDDISSVANISTAMTANSTQWANKVGIGLKVMVEPNGNHNYLDAGRQNSGVCWNIFQNSTSEYPDNDKTIADWTDGSMPSTFSSKPTGGYIRSFFQGNESSWKTNVDAADGTRMIIGGTHGLGDEIKSHLRSASNVTNNAWVGSADEVWEYYHIYNNVQIENVNYDDINKNLTFDVKVPTYKKNQYRELTLNIPGLTGGGTPSFTGTSVITGGYQQTSTSGIGYTMNIGLETSITDHINQLMAIYRDDQTNEFVKRDLEYLISQLWDGTSYTSQLNETTKHDLTIESSLGTTLATIKTDTDGDKSFAVPRYIVSDDKLYEVAANSSRPNYAQTITTTTTPSAISYSEKSLSSLAVSANNFIPKAVLLVEGEDMTGVTILGADLDLPQTSHGRYWAMALGSNGMAGNLVSGKTATVTSALPRGKYKAVIGYGETYKSQGTYNYNLLVDGVQAATVSSSSAVNNAVTELTTAEFDVTVNNQPITLTTDNTNAGSRWIDYIYFVQTGSLEPQAPSVAATASAGTTAAIKKGNPITITATATQRGGSEFSGISLYKYTNAPVASARAAEPAQTLADGGELVATSTGETVSYTFTPSEAGNYYFKAIANDATLGDGTSDLITVNAVDEISTYTLSIIDKSGNVALTTTVAGASLTTDPLPDAYRSPFAQNYKYYNTIAEAQANSGSALATTDDWIQSTVYVGYDVDNTKMGAGKVHAIWGNGQIMHIIYNAKNSKNAPTGTGTLDWYKNAQYDVEDPKKDYSTGPYIQHSNISATSLPFLDNTYMWDLGTDPYNIKLRNKAFNVYASSTAYDARTLYDHDHAASAESYCLLYWRDRNSSGYGSVDTSAEYYRLMHRGNQEQILQGWSNQWGASADLNNWNTRGKLYVKELPAVNLNVLDAKKNVECTLQYYLKSDANMPTDGTDEDSYSYYTPFNLYRSYTSKHKWWYDAAATDAITNGSAPDASKITKNGGNIYVTYTLDSKWNSNNVFYTYPEGKGTVHWYTVNFKNNKTGNYYLIASTGISDPLPGTYESSDLSTADYDSNHKEYYWAFSGTPYNLKLINMYHGSGNYLGVAKANTAYMASTYLLPDNNDNNVTWEMVDGLYWEQRHPYLRLQKSLNGETEASDRPLYLRRDWNSSYNPLLDRTTDGYTLFLFTEKTTTDITSVSLSASAGPYYVDQAMTLTATAIPSPSGTDRVSSLVIEQEVNGEWTAVTTAEAATKDETTKAVTVTYSFTPAAEGTFNFRAYAVVDGEDQYSTAEASAGGDGDVVEVIATVKQIAPKNSSYTLTLIDKDGNELLTETNVPASRITSVNSLTNRNGDPFDNAYRSPLVTTYKYYEGTEAGKASAVAADDNNQVDWNTYTGTTVYVGYTVSDAIDLNGKDSNGNYKFSSLNNDANSLMQNRVHRDNNDANPLVRDASKFGKMYLLKFKTNAAYYSENGSDGRESNPTPSGSFVYPYTNGDGPIYVYDDARYQKQKDDGASTRTRWPWFLVSPNGDPYHVYITSWQNAHSVVTGKDANNKDVSTNYYSYLRTYYNSTTGTVVTNNVTDDPSTLDGSSNQILPTDYMILRGSGTDGLNYKLTTVATIYDGTTTERRTVTSLEQYWRNNPTAQEETGGTKNGDPVATDNAQLKGYGWNNYSAYVNAAKWDGTNYDNGKPKKYLNDSHWFQTISLGDGSLDIVEANIDGVLVLLDNHGWEIMRKPIVAKDDPDYETVRTALRKYDSPMVKQYKFYSTRNVKHKVAGYHKYDINRQTDTVTPTTPLTDAADRVDKDKTITSLADYPESMKDGALTDLYVTYEVKDEYANSYTGAATEAATSASNFLLKQGSSYAKANGTAIESTSDASAADHWKLKPNFNIDAEMGYCYDGSGNNHNNELTQAALETLYYNGGTDSRNGFDPYNIQIQNATTNTYFTTNASTATLDGGIWSGDGSTLSLQTIATRISPTGSDNKTLAVTNATFMAVQDQYGNMRLMPRFQHEQVVDNFATLADPATLSAYDATNAQTTQLTTPVTYHIIDNSGNDALQMTVTSGIGLSVPDALKSPMVSAYQFHSTLAHAATAETRGTGDLTVAQENVYVSYTVDATKMASTKKYAISSGASDVFLHRVFRGSQSNSSYSNFANRYILNNQIYDQENANSLSPSPNQLNHSNLPFVDNTYLWTLGDDPYNIVITSAVDDNWKYVGRDTGSGKNGQLQQANSTDNAVKYCLLYWNGNPNSDYSVLRYSSTNSNPTTETYVQYDGNNNSGRWVDASANSEANAKLLIEELPEVNVNVVNAAGTVEYTLAGRYISTATVPGTTTVPFFLQRLYTSGHTYYYNAACDDQMTADNAPDATKMESGKTDDKYNIYVRYVLDDDWNTENLFKVSTAEAKEYYILKYTANTSTPYMGLDETSKELKGTNVSTTDDTHWALYGTPYALRIENQKYPNYYIGIPETVASNTKPKIYNSFDGIISTWELSAYTNSNITPADYRPLPFIRPQGSISRETPLIYLRPDGTNKAYADVDDKINRVTFEAAAKVTLVVVDKDGREVISEQVSPATVTSTSGDPLSAELRSPYAKNYKYYANAEEAKTNSGEALDASGISAKVDDTVYVGYDINAADGETILHTDGTAYRIRRNTSDTQGMHATFLPSGANSSDNNYGWKMERQSRDYDDGSSNLVNYNTLPFIDRSWAWEFVNSNGDPYSVKIRNKATGQYLRCENNSTRSYQAMFTDSESEAAIYSLLQFGTGTNYLAIYVTDNNVSQTGYLYYNSSDDGTWRLRSTRNDGNNSALAYIRVEELTTPLDIHVVAPANAPNAGEVETTLHGYRNTGVGANTVPSFAPYFLARAYTSDQKFYYTKAAAAAATSDTEISTVDDNSITDSYGSDGILDVFVSYTLDAANWIPSGTALSDAAKTANTTIIKPFYSSEKKINWYGIRANQDNSDFLKAESTTLPTPIGRSTISTATNDLDTEAMKRSEWAIIGTPYNLQLVERYHGTAAHLGMAEDAVSGTSRAYVYPSGTEDVVTTFELVTGLSGTSGKLFLRPQGALNAQAPNLYIGGNDNNMAVSRSANSAQIIDLTWLKETDAKTVTFTLRDRDGNDMSSIVDDFTLIGVAEGDDLADLFSTTGLARRYCNYTYYGDAALTTTVEEVGSDDDKTVYVQWQYTDDAPVFSTGSETRDYQYYMVSVHNGSNSYMMNVTGNSTDGYNLLKISTDHPHTTLKEGHTQFALVGNPYAFKLYSRYAGKNLRTNSSGAGLTFLDALDEVATTEAVFDLPIPVNTSITRSTQMDVRMKAHPEKHIWGTASEFWMGSSTGCFAQLMYMVVPVRVFQEGSTALANIVDYQEYALDLNPSNAAVSTDARITDADLYPSTLSGSANYYTKDFRHAFCDYTFYHTYDWTTGALSNAIPTTGTYAGLPYYGGSSDQFARAFFATYTVDEEQFSKVYLLDNANSGTPKYFGSGDATTSGDNVYYPTVSAYNTVDAARNDDTNAYRWVMTGDPYNLQLTCLGTGDDYEEIPLGVTTVSTTNAEPTQPAGTLALLTNDATYAVKSHWEVILNNDGNHIFYLVDDVENYDDEDRYTYSLGTYNYMLTKLFASSDKLYTLHLTPAVPQYDVVWKVMEGSSGSYTEVASYTKENVSKGTTLTLADMPEVLRRHFCKYENMYSNEACTTQYAGNEATVGDAELDIYVPYTLAAGAPMFYESVETFNAATGDDKDPVLIRLNHAKYAYTTAATDESATTTDSKQTASTSKWVLIGSPYNVKLYNISTGKYLYVNWSNISPNAVIPMDASPATGTTNDTWTILDDATGDYAVLCLKEDDNHQMLFIGYDGSGNVVMNIPNSKSEAMTAEFLGSNGIDNPTLVLHYGANTLRQDANNNSMAGQTENFQVSGFFNLGTPLVDIMPSVMKRPFCNYTFEYNNVEYETVVKDPMCTAPQPITIHVYYTRDESLFKWSTATTDYTGKYWYYLVNNHVPAGSSEQGKMYYRDSSPKLRVSEALVQNKLYLNNYEWCVIGDPYGFKMLNHYDPDRKFSEYIRVMDYTDNHKDGLQLEQNDDNDNQNIFEMMPGTYSYNFWMHPVYSSTQLAEYAADSYSFVSQNYNGSAAIIPTGKKTMAYLKTNSSANLRLEILSDATLAEYVKYAGFVGALKYDVANSDALEVGGETVDVADIKAKVLDGTATDADKTMLHNIINDPANIEQMVQGYYRIVPFTQEGGSEHNYIRGYIDEDEKTNSGGMNRNLKVENQATAEYDPASIFWFEGTTHDGTENGYPRYFIKTQGLSLDHTGLVDINASSNYKCRYENLGAAITQIKVATDNGNFKHDYISVSSTDTETSTNQCFDEQAGNYKTRFYLQKVNNTNENEMAFKMKLNKGHSPNGILPGNEALGNLPYSYASLYVPYDVEVVGGVDLDGNEIDVSECVYEPFIGIRENYHPTASQSSDVYYNQGEYALVCEPIGGFQKQDKWKGKNTIIPAGTPIVIRSTSGLQQLYFTIPTNEPTAEGEALTVTNKLTGIYLKKVDAREALHVFGRESVHTANGNFYTGRVGLFKRWDPTVKLNNNRIQYIEEEHPVSQPNTNAARGVLFMFNQDDFTTGMPNSFMLAPEDGDALYDMQGRKLSRTTKPGVYIMNGKKVVVK